jgi:hypothetical protein
LVSQYLQSIRSLVNIVANSALIENTERDFYFYILENHLSASEKKLLVLYITLGGSTTDRYVDQQLNIVAKAEADLASTPLLRGVARRYVQGEQSNDG